MSTQRWELSRVRAYREAAASFGVDASASIGSFVDVAHIEADLDPGIELLDNGNANQLLFKERKDIVGPARPKMSLKTYLAGTGTGLGDAASSPLTEAATGLGMLLQTAMGGYNSDNGTAEGANTSSVPSSDGLVYVTDAANAKVGNGRAVGLLKTDGTIEVAEIGTRSAGAPDDIWTLKYKSSFDPADQSVVYNSHEWHFEAVTKTLQFAVERAEPDCVIWLLGCIGPFSIELPLHELPMLTFDIMGAQWAQDDDSTIVSTPINAAMTAATETEAAPAPFVSSEVILIDTSGGVIPYTRRVVHPTSISLNTGWSFQPLRTPAGVNGYRGYTIQRDGPVVTGEITLPFDSSSTGTEFLTALRAGTTYGLWIQIGATIGSTVFISLPCIQITSVKPAESDGQVGQVVGFKALDDPDAGAASDEARSPMRIATL